LKRLLLFLSLIVFFSPRVFAEGEKACFAEGHARSTERAGPVAGLPQANPPTPRGCVILFSMFRIFPGVFSLFLLTSRESCSPRMTGDRNRVRLAPFWEYERSRE